MSRWCTRGLVYHDSGSQNVRILKHDKHSEITIRATLALASPANRGVFNTAWSLGKLGGRTRAFSVSSRKRSSSRKWTRANLARINISSDSFWLAKSSRGYFRVSGKNLNGKRTFRIQKFSNSLYKKLICIYSHTISVKCSWIWKI